MNEPVVKGGNLHARSPKLKCWFFALLAGVSPMLARPALLLLERLGCLEHDIGVFHCPPIASFDPGPLAEMLFQVSVWGLNYSVPIGGVVFMLCGFVPWRRRQKPSCGNMAAPSPSTGRASLRNMAIAVGMALVLAFFVGWLVMAYTAHSLWQERADAWTNQKPRLESARVVDGGRHAAGGLSGTAADATRVAAVPTTPGPVPVQFFAVAVNPADGRVWIRGGTTDYPHVFNTLYRVDPASGQSEQYSMPGDPFHYSSRPLSIATSRGLLLIGGRFIEGGRWLEDPARVAALTVDNIVLEARLQVPRERPQTLVLGDGSVLVVGGIAERYVDGHGVKQLRFSSAVERVSLAEGVVSVERLPDLPGAPRRDVSLVELGDGRVMVLGGSTSRYYGAEPMVADTYVLDLNEKVWRAGPSMMEPRCAATATLFPDGSVFVAGGWTPGHTWNEGPARGTERWNPRDGGFQASDPLPLGVAGHQAQWAAGHHGRYLLVLGGRVTASTGNHTVLAYDAARGLWGEAGTACEEYHHDDLLAVSFVREGRTYLWCQRQRKERVPGSSDLIAMQPAALRLPFSTADQPREDAGEAEYRPGVAILPPQGDAPGLAVGGQASVGRYDRGAPSAFVEAIWSDGHSQTLAPLNHVRCNARVFRLRDGSFLVAGGVNNASARGVSALPMEVLPGRTRLDQSRWIDLEEKFQKDTALGQLASGELIAVGPDGDVDRLAISIGPGGVPLVRRGAMPPLNFKRRGNPDINELPDGRIVVAGGVVQRHRIVELREDSLSSDSADRYVGLGSYVPARTCEVYSPATGAWREIAPSGADGVLCAGQ